MLNRTKLFLLGAAVLAGSACGGDDGSGPGPREAFVATLIGDFEVPPVQTPASALAEFTVTGATVEYVLQVAAIEDATAAHIHSGAAGVNGAVLVPLYPIAGGPVSFSGTGTMVSASFDADDIVGDSVSYDALVGRLGDETLYVNVHTAANPDGEIRGQITEAE